MQQYSILFLDVEHAPEEDNVKNFLSGLEDCSASKSDKDDSVFVFLANYATELWYEDTELDQVADGSVLIQPPPPSSLSFLSSFLPPPSITLSLPPLPPPHTYTYLLLLLLLLPAPPPPPPPPPPPLFFLNLLPRYWWDEKEEQWKWTPDWEFWMPCSSTVVS